MIEIGDRPILWHIMKIYSSFGLNDFIVCLGYKGYIVKEYFLNYSLHQADVIIDIGQNAIEYVTCAAEPWRVSLIDTGSDTMTGGRLRRIRSYVGNKTFCMTYGDGVSDVDIEALLASHRRYGCIATVTAVRPPGRFGSIDMADGRVRGFKEKPIGDGGWINGGFFVLEPKVFDLIEGDATVWEREPLEQLATSGQLHAFRHEGFWQAMDTLRDKRQLEAVWNEGRAPWKRW